MNAKIVLDKILEKNLGINEALEICEKLCESERLTIGDVMRIKKTLELTNVEAAEIFLS